MDGAILHRSLSCAPLTCTKHLSCSSRRLVRRIPSLLYLPRQHCLLQRTSFLGTHLTLISSASVPSLHLKRHFSLPVRAVASPLKDPSTEALGADDEVAEKLGFEKVSDQFLEDCKS